MAKKYARGTGSGILTFGIKGGDDAGARFIDALELIVLLEKNYGIKIENPKDGQKIFFSVKTLAEYITENQK